MSGSQPSRAGSELVDAYLADLDRALRHADPASRDEVVSTVAEHIDHALAERPQPVGTRDVEEVLTALGPVERVAAGTDRDPGAPDPALRSAPWPRWTAPLVLVLGAVSIPLVPLNAWLALPTAVVAIVLGVLGARAHQGRSKRPYQAGAALGGLALVLLAAAALASLRAGSDAPQPSPPVPVTSAP
ncbi:hypothetical protein B0I33_108313 [Prauserella shujinwangii]|uniref:Uncharacterized protein n=1 Tax=Prauserella shujinwangii TaxID=1453103 RepID=A0A2T0LRP2_9PSEU|nr:hypothetical protein [Prauserella shujinwangii]PRX46166.1 hypothetical protein B0I33_108313 [Prauserella shujinwangii]